jgi:hypothetical protein
MIKKAFVGIQPYKPAFNAEFIYPDMEYLIDLYEKLAKN